MTCHYCHTNPGQKPHAHTLWNGFRDSDMGRLVCFTCREKHYLEKSSTAMANQYSELPVMMPFIQQLPIQF